jgi:hypothetical protein
MKTALATAVEIGRERKPLAAWVPDAILLVYMRESWAERRLRSRISTHVDKRVDYNSLGRIGR